MSATLECRTEEQTAHHKVKAPAVLSPAFPYIHVSRRQQPGPLVISGNLIFFFLPLKMTMMEMALIPAMHSERNISQ